MIMTVGEVAKFLRVHQTTVYRLLRDGKIPAFKVGSDWRFESKTLERWIHGDTGLRKQPTAKLDDFWPPR
jgi:excisionase family DNA binding protein